MGNGEKGALCCAYPNLQKLRDMGARTHRGDGWLGVVARGRGAPFSGHMSIFDLSHGCGHLGYGWQISYNPVYTLPTRSLNCRSRIQEQQQMNIWQEKNGLADV